MPLEIIDVIRLTQGACVRLDPTADTEMGFLPLTWSSVPAWRKKGGLIIKVQT